MTQDLRDSIKKIRSLSPKLNAATDEANASVARVEKFLNDECSIGIPTAERAFKVEDLPGRGKERWWRLCYDRVDGKFRIAIARLRVEPDQDNPDHYRYIDEEVRPWASCPRDEKLESFVSLPALLQAIATAVESASDKSHATAETVNQIVKAMNGTSA